jgi:hypothetical protein
VQSFLEVFRGEIAHVRDAAEDQREDQPNDSSRSASE